MNWWRRIRAAIVIGLTWGGVWLGAGTVLARVPGVDSDLPFALLFAPLGFVSGSIFAGLLVAIERRRGVGRASLPRFTGWGAASGLLLAGILVAGAAIRGANPWAEFLLFGPPLAVASALCAAGSLVVARRAERRALPSDSGTAAEPIRTADETTELLRRGD